MAHKGYTLNYFIDFFRDTKPSEWTCGRERQNTDNGAKFCAIGFAGAVNEQFETTTKARQDALLKLLPSVVSINDLSKRRFAKLGKTPRTRVIRALKLRKRLGLAEFNKKILGNKDVD